MATTPDPLAVAIGTAVHNATRRQGQTLDGLAHRSGIARMSMWRRTKGFVPFTWPELVRISDVLDIALSELVADAEREAARSAA